jgi:hypothetical protein
MIVKLFCSRVNILLISFLSAVFIAAILQYMWIAAAVILLTFLIFYFGKDISLALIILAYLVVADDGAGSIRNILNITALLVLTFIFLQKYGFEYKNYPGIPR